MKDVNEVEVGDRYGGEKDYTVVHSHQNQNNMIVCEIMQTEIIIAITIKRMMIVPERH